MKRAYIIRVNGTKTELDHCPTMEEARKVIGGYVELVKAREGAGKLVTLVVNEDGKPLGLPTNREVIKTYGSSIYGGFIVGDVIVLEGWRSPK